MLPVLPMPAYRKPPPERMTRRFQAVYLALSATRAREIIAIVGSGRCGSGGEENAFLQELALIVDDALQAELERRRAGG